MAGIWDEISGTIWNKIIKTDIWTTNFLLLNFGNVMTYIMNYALSNLP